MAVDREGLQNALTHDIGRTLVACGPGMAIGVGVFERVADALIAGPLAEILTQADTAAQAVEARDEYAEHIIDLECKATRDAGQIARLSAEVEARDKALRDLKTWIDTDLEPGTPGAGVAHIAISKALAAGQDKTGGGPRPSRQEWLP